MCFAREYLHPQAIEDHIILPQLICKELKNIALVANDGI